MRIAIILVLVVGAVIGLLSAFLPDSTARNPPRVPVDVFHSIVVQDSGCLTCHTPGRQSPLKDSHPRKTSCFSCHATRGNS